MSIFSRHLALELDPGISLVSSYSLSKVDLSSIPSPTNTVAVEVIYWNQDNRKMLEYFSAPNDSAKEGFPILSKLYHQALGSWNVEMVSVV